MSGCWRCSTNVTLEPDRKITQPWLHLDAPAQINCMLSTHTKACWYWQLSIQVNFCSQIESGCLKPIFVITNVRYLAALAPLAPPQLFYKWYVFLHQEKGNQDTSAPNLTLWINVWKMAALIAWNNLQLMSEIVTYSWAWREEKGKKDKGLSSLTAQAL